MNRRTVQVARPAGAEVEAELRARLAALREMTVGQLQDVYYGLYGRATPGRNREWLIRRCFYREQERATGLTLSDRARARIAELSEGMGVRSRPPRGEPLPPHAPDAPPRDPRLPPVGTIIRREHDGVVHEIAVLQDGFVYAGQAYRSLSAIAKEVTGTSWNGYLWAGLTERKKRSGTRRGDG